jgi:hypothetical protein
MPNASSTTKPSKSKVVLLHKKKHKKKEKKHASQPTTGVSTLPLTEETRQLLSLVPGHKMTGKVVVKEQPVVRTPSTKPPFHTQAIKKDVIQPALSPYSFSPEKYEYKPPPEPEKAPKQINPYAQLGIQAAHIASYAVGIPLKNALVGVASEGSLSLNQKILGETLLKQFNPDKKQYKTDIESSNQKKKALEMMKQDYERWKKDNSFPYRKEGLEPGAPNEIVPFEDYVKKIRTGEWKQPDMYTSAGERMLLDAEKKMHQWRYEKYAPTLPDLKEEFKEGVIPEPNRRASDTVQRQYDNLELEHRKDYKDIIDAYKTKRLASRRVDQINMPGVDSPINLVKYREHIYKKINPVAVRLPSAISSNDKFFDYLEKHSKAEYPHSWFDEHAVPTQAEAATHEATRAKARSAQEEENARFEQYRTMSERQNKLKSEKDEEQVDGATRGLVNNEHENFTDEELPTKATAFGLDVPSNATPDQIKEAFAKYKQEWESSGPAYLKVASPTYNKFQEYHTQLQNPDLNVEKKRQILQNITSHTLDPTDPYHVEAKQYQEKAATQINNFNENFRKSMEPVEYLPQSQKDVWTATRDIEGLPQKTWAQAKIGATRYAPAMLDVMTSAGLPFLLEWGFNKWEDKLVGENTPTPNIPLWVQQSMLQHVVPTGYTFAKSAAV